MSISVVPVSGVAAGCKRVTPSDVYHLHDWYGGLVVDALLELGMRNIVSTSHLPLRFGFTYRDSDLSWRRKCLLEQRVFDVSRVVIAPSRYCKDFLQSEYGIHHSKITIIQHGVTTDELGCSDLRPVNSANILAVGRFVDQKGFSVLIRAFKELQEVWESATLTLIGDGPRWADYTSLVASLRAQNVVIKPTHSKDELKKQFRRSTLLVIPSICEPFGLVGLEAMACGCPVVATCPSGTSEYLTADEGIATLSPKRMAAELDFHLRRVIADPEIRRKARKRAELFSWTNTALRHRQIYGIRNK